MADYIIPLPSGFRYLNQFAPSQWAEHPSLYRCVAAVWAMLMEISYPGKWIPEELMHDLYVLWAGPDVASDTQGIDKAPVLAWAHKNGVGFVDMANLLGDTATLLHVIERQNEMGIPQLITVADESFLKDAKTGVKLHNWNDAGMGHAILRAGFSDSDGYGLYFEPAAPGFAQPVPISWADSIVPAHIVTAVAVMPHTVPQPPADFDWLHNTWPAPKPTLDVTKALNTIGAMQQALDAMKAAMGNLANDVAALKQEV
jgi:hypothetical protein